MEKLPDRIISMEQMDKEQIGTDRVHMRTAESTDAENITRLVNMAFRPERFFIDGDRTDPDQVRALFHKGKFLLVEEVDALVGCVYVELRGERGYFGLLSIDPERQRSGLGTHLVKAAEEYCRAAGCLFMDLTVVNLRTHIPAYYRRHGYSESGTLPFPADHNPQPRVPCHLVRMSKPLA
jgi:ribosomal protein S18 acetylase RimI-like enzyme